MSCKWGEPKYLKKLASNWKTILSKAISLCMHEEEAPVNYYVLLQNVLTLNLYSRTMHWTDAGNRQATSNRTRIHRTTSIFCFLVSVFQVSIVFYFCALWAKRPTQLIKSSPKTLLPCRFYQLGRYYLQRILESQALHSKIC